MKKEFIYSLRLSLCYDFQAEEKFEKALIFCEKAEINDIQFFFNMEDHNRGHLTLEETKDCVEMIDSFKERVKLKEITYSLNPWNTTLHTDRGRKLKKGQNFVTMTDYNGKKLDAVACPSCKNFLTYISDIYAYYATFGFDIIWVEDDFRMHNHAPLEWGGCFCDLHMKEFSKRAGKELVREEFIQGIVKKGEPHPYRKIWLDTINDTMNEFAKVLGDAVHDTAPETRVALMSSNPQTHCVEGRNWKTVFENMSGETRALNRPHMPPYNEMRGAQYCLEFQRVSRLLAYSLSPNVELWPEIENYPHTSFSKSNKFTKFQIETAISLCSEGISLNIFDMVGNGINPTQKLDTMLKDIKSYMNAVCSLELNLKEETGVHVMFSPNSSYTIHSTGKRTLKSIQPNDSFWAEYLAAFGIANKFCDDITISGKIVAISGQYFRNLNRTEIKSLMENNYMLLNADAVDTLCSMDCGDLLGIKNAKWCPSNIAHQSFEQVSNGKIYQGLSNARMSAQVIFEDVEMLDYLSLEFDQPMKVYSQLRSPSNEVVGNGYVTNDKFAVLPYGHLLEYYMAIINPIRREILCDILENTNTQAPAMVLETQYVSINHFKKGQEDIVILSNFSTDKFDNITIKIPSTYPNCDMISRTTGERNKIICKQGDDGSVVIPVTLESLTTNSFIFYN